MDSGVLQLVIGAVSLLILIILFGVMTWKSKLYRLIIIVFVLTMATVWIYPSFKWYFLLDEGTRQMVNIPVTSEEAENMEYLEEETTEDEGSEDELLRLKSIEEYTAEIRKSIDRMRDILNYNEKLYRYPTIITPEQEKKIPAEFDIRITDKYGVGLDIDDYKLDINRDILINKILMKLSDVKDGTENVEELADNFLKARDYAVKVREELLWIEELKELMKETVRLGLDLAGGISFTLDVDMDVLRGDIYQQYESRLDEESIRASEDFAEFQEELKTSLLNEIKNNISNEERNDIRANIIDEGNLTDPESKEFKEEFDNRLTKLAERTLENDEYQEIIKERETEQIEKIKKEAQQDIQEAIQFRKEETKKDALEILRKRIDQFGVSEPEIGKTLGDRPIVNLPGADDPASARNLVTKAGKLEFRIVDSELMDKISNKSYGLNMSKGLLRPHDTAETLYNALKKENPDIDFQYLPEADKVYVPSESGNPEEDSYAYQQSYTDKRGERVLEGWMFLKNKVEMEGKHIINPTVQLGGQQGVANPYIAFELDNEGTTIFAEVTGNNKGERLAILLDGYIQTAPSISDRIVGRGSITGNFTVESARDLVSILKAGSISSKLKIVSENVIGPKLGEENIKSGIMATIIGLSLVMLFMQVYYKAGGLFANIALILNLYLLISILSMFHFTLTLPGIAGILLTIGMAVDANVLIFERIKEELRNGKPITAAVDEGFSRAFGTIFDANLTTILAAIVLSQVGTGPLKGFGITLAIGIACSMFTALVVSKLLIDVMVSITKGKKLWI